MSHQPGHAQPHRQPQQRADWPQSRPVPPAPGGHRDDLPVPHEPYAPARTTPPGRAVMTPAASFWYVLGCIAFGAMYLAKVPAKKALAEAGLAEMTAAEKFWYVLQCIAFGGGYFAKLPVKKALTELAR
jgi:hypothetical protein